LANLFLHYAFDRWMDRQHPDPPFERYADDAGVHCRTAAAAEQRKADLGDRLAAVGLELHPTKTRIVYCQDDDRRGTYPETRFDFLGYTFRPRRSKSRQGHDVINFTPAVSADALTAMRQAIHDWRLHLKVDRTLDDLARWVQRKYKHLARRPRRAMYWLGGVARQDASRFIHWQRGWVVPAMG
jgi:RNA-directed DNA polymerase